MRDYDMERFLMHYGIPGMKRPRGLKYKTKNNGSVSLYQRRKEQMNKDSSTADEDLRKKAKVRLLTYSQRNTGVNSPEKRAKREEDRKKFQEELNARVAERERNEQERLETAKKKMQQSKNKLLGKSNYKPDYGDGFMAKQKKEMAKKYVTAIKNNKKNIGSSSEWTKTVNDLKAKKNEAAQIVRANKKIKELRAKEALEKMKNSSLYKTITKEPVESKIKTKNDIQKSKDTAIKNKTDEEMKKIKNVVNNTTNKIVKTATKRKKSTKKQDRLWGG